MENITAAQILNNPYLCNILLEQAYETLALKYKASEATIKAAAERGDENLSKNIADLVLSGARWMAENVNQVAA